MALFALFFLCLFLSSILDSVKPLFIDPFTPKSRYFTRSWSSEDVRSSGGELRSSYSHHPRSSSSTSSSTSSSSSSTYVFSLKMSDEFEVENRTFNDGDDPLWTALDKNDYTNDALHYYKGENVYTSKGVLTLRSSIEATTFKDFLESENPEQQPRWIVRRKHFTSGLVQSWGKFCFTGGIVELRVRLPGYWDTGGLWPAAWLLGSLTRATYVASSEGIWPFSYNTCDSGAGGQEISACGNNPHYGLGSHVGRGAPEVDIFEVMAGDPTVPLPNSLVLRKPYTSSSLQVAPGVKTKRPVLGFPPVPPLHWYEGLRFGNESRTTINNFFYGSTVGTKKKKRGGEEDTKADHEDAGSYQTDAISANTALGEDAFSSFKVFRLEWEPPRDSPTTSSSSASSLGRLAWYLDGEFLFEIKGESLARMTGSEIPLESMHIVLNTAISSTWGFPVPDKNWCTKKCFDCAEPACLCNLPKGFCKNFPAFLDIDYVRVYQDSSENSNHVLGCSPRARPTKLFIEAHKERYVDKGEEDRPLQVQAVQGGGKCRSGDDHPKTAATTAASKENRMTKNGGDHTCGMKQGRGRCIRGRCVCDSARGTGPHCLATPGNWAGYSNYEDVSRSTRLPDGSWIEVQESGVLSGFHIPRFPRYLTFAVVLCFLCFLIFPLGFGTFVRKRKRMNMNSSSSHDEGGPIVGQYGSLAC